MTPTGVMKSFNLFSNLRRAVLPQVMFDEDVASVLGTDVPTARTAMRDGDCGPLISIRGRIAVLRASFLSHLQAGEQGADCEEPEEVVR